MKTFKLILSIVAMLVGFCAAFYCGIGSLFILGDKNTEFHQMGYTFLAIATGGAAVSILGIVTLVRIAASHRTTPPSA